MLSVSLGHGFPWGDVAEMGTRVLVVTDDRARAVGGKHRPRDLGRQIFDLRATWCSPITTAWPSAHRAMAVGRAGGPDRAWPTSPTMPAAAHPTTRPSCCAALLDAESSTISAVGRHLGSRDGHGGHGSWARARDLPMRIGGKVGPMSGPPLDLTVTVTKIVADATQTFGLPPDTNEWRMGASVASAHG